MRDVIYEQPVSSDPFASDDEFAMIDIVTETKDTLTRDFILSYIIDDNTHTVKETKVKGMNFCSS